MISKLKKIAKVSFGATFRSRVETSPSGNMRLIQMKDLGGDNLVHLHKTVRVNLSKPKSGQLVRAGDIIFRSRGQTNTAALLNEKAEGVVLAAPLFRVRVNAKKVIPEYLLWWINQASSQNYLRSQAEGTMIKMISKQSLENLVVELPALEQQAAIAKLFSLST